MERRSLITVPETLFHIRGRLLPALGQIEGRHPYWCRAAPGKPFEFDPLEPPDVLLIPPVGALAVPLLELPRGRRLSEVVAVVPERGLVELGFGVD
jgi:hypothetical protein